MGDISLTCPENCRKMGEIEESQRNAKLVEQNKEHLQNTRDLMKVVQVLLDKNVDKVGETFKAEVVEALYDRYSDEIIAKAEILSDEILKEKLAATKCDKEMCKYAIQLWKNKATLVETEFNKLLEHLKGQGIDVDHEQKEKTTPSVPAPPIAPTPSISEPKSTTSTTPTEKDILKSILSNVNKEKPKTKVKPAARAVRTCQPTQPLPPLNADGEIEEKTAEKPVATSSKEKIDVATAQQTISSDSDNDDKAAPKTPRKKPRKRLNRLSNVMPEQNKQPQRTGWGASPPQSP